MARMKREGKAQMEALAKELGFESADAMKAAAKAKAEADLAAKSDLEKEKLRADKAEQEKKDALTAANTRLVNAEIKVFAVQAGFVDPADAVALVDKASVQVDDQGNVTGAKEAVETLAKAKPHLVGTGKPGGSPGSLGNGGQQGGGTGNQAGDFGKQLAEKRAAEAKKRSEGAHNYFK
ncbi:MAG TPA: scaffolding protein [Desulfotomaculum sp.]|nr:scaffolding protein [Desulfotomaculum sp.]